MGEHGGTFDRHLIHVSTSVPLAYVAAKLYLQDPDLLSVLLSQLIILKRIEVVIIFFALSLFFSLVFLHLCFGCTILAV